MRSGRNQLGCHREQSVQLGHMTDGCSWTWLTPRRGHAAESPSTACGGPALRFGRFAMTATRRHGVRFAMDFDGSVRPIGRRNAPSKSDGEKKARLARRRSRPRSTRASGLGLDAEHGAASRHACQPCLRTPISYVPGLNKSEAIQDRGDCGCGLGWIASLSLAMTIGTASTSGQLKGKGRRCGAILLIRRAPAA